MDSPSANYLTIRQKVRLALSVLAIYWPIRVYVNISPLSWVVVGHNLPFLAVELVLTFVLLLGWVFLMDELQGRLMRRFGQTDTGELQLPTQLLTVVVAVGLALLFNGLFGQLHQRSERRIEHEFPRLGHASDDPFDARPNDMGQRRRMNNGLTVMALLAAFYLTANRRSTRRIQQLQLQAERLEKEAVQAQFDALKNQVNPHFLFNSLSILSSLVDTDTKLAGQFINRLSKAYRYILEQRDNEQVSLRTELDFIAAYTFLLTLRFEDKLFVSIEVSQEARDRYSIAPLTLQLLLENAVKHNRLSEEEPLQVRISLDGDYLRVTNPIHPRPDLEPSTRIGLQNITNRYRLLTPQPVWVGEENGTFVVKLPLLSERAKE
ncbi:sensor histidine kinase [Spirosoma pollinicola]|uniref:Histidine kinase n=1 Tax=Spirosoma pollinicola TaxID=2057025 RepID=A0A2K8Z7I0_9BACT|nr:histidine kinase [Spirosoma pollinicola]AUD05810.1 histidine kinase [Spirosoma pollinicola]